MAISQISSQVERDIYRISETRIFVIKKVDGEAPPSNLERQVEIHNFLYTQGMPVLGKANIRKTSEFSGLETPYKWHFKNIHAIKNRNPEYKYQVKYEPEGIEMNFTAAKRASFAHPTDYKHVADLINTAHAKLVRIAEKNNRTIIVDPLAPKFVLWNPEKDKIHFSPLSWCELKVTPTILIEEDFKRAFSERESDYNNISKTDLYLPKNTRH